jgi:hypothetical protein
MLHTHQQRAGQSGLAASQQEGAEVGGVGSTVAAARDDAAVPTSKEEDAA